MTNILEKDAWYCQTIHDEWSNKEISESLNEMRGIFLETLTFKMFKQYHD